MDVQDRQCAAPRDLGLETAARSLRRAVFFAFLLLVPLVSNAAEQSGSKPDGKKPPQPVIVIVFDELPLSSLQDASGSVDAARYPAFARLEKTSHFFTGVTTVATRDLDAIPAILTGIRPGVERKLSINAEHPNNLFSLLEATHALHVMETYTLVQASKEPRALGHPDPQVAEIKLIRKDGNRSMNQPNEMRHFTRDMTRQLRSAGPGSRSLHFLHVMLPSSPWRYTARGKLYEPARLSGSRGEKWLEEPWWVDDGYRRHLVQLEYTDLLLGRMLQSLDQIGAFDDALLVVTASFGLGFWPGQSRLRIDETEHPEDMLNVPLFIKLPGQAEGKRIADPGETIDIVPTIADVLETAPSWTLDGCSLFSEECEAITERVTISYGTQRHLMHSPLDIVSRRDTLERKLALVGSGADRSRFARFGPYAELVGRDVASLEPGEKSAGLVTPSRTSPKSRARRGSQLNPLVSGVLTLDAELEGTPYVAVVLGEQIVTIVPALNNRRKKRSLSALLPDSALEGRSERPKLFLVSGPAKKPVLAPLGYTPKSAAPKR